MYKKRYNLLALGLCLLDCALAVGSFFLAGFIRYGSVSKFITVIDAPEGLVVIILSVIAFYYLLNMYDQFVKRGYMVEFVRVLQLNVCVFIIIAIYTFTTKNAFALSRLTLAYFAVSSTVAQYIAHCILKKAMRKGPSKNAALDRHMLLIVNSDKAEQTVERTRQTSEWRYIPVGLVLMDCDRVGEQIDGIDVVATRDTCLAFATTHVVDEVLIIPSDNGEENEFLKHTILDFESMGIPVNVEIRTIDTGINDVKRMYRFGDFNVVGFSSRLYDYRMILLKRLMDIVGSIVGLIGTCIIGIFIVPLIMLESPGSAIFTHTRIGRNGRPFKVYKFRSMCKDAEERKAELADKNEMKGSIFKITDDPRVTKVGAFIRKTSIDELPQFWNVLRGDMSLVGTRPPTEEEYMQYTHRQKKRLSFKPGITGLWQVSGRNKISDFDEIVKLDLEYIDNWSIALDIKILLKTVKVVLTREGAV